MNDDILAACRFFVEADAWGAFNTGSMARVLRTAGWPEHVQPYTLRHSTGIDLSEAGADLADASPFLGHASLQTTRSVYVPMRNSRMQRLSTQIDGRLHGWAVPSDVPSSDSAIPANLSKHRGSQRAGSRREIEDNELISQ